MKIALVCVLLLFFSAPVLAQHLSLRNLLKLREMEVPDVHKKLSRKGWTFMSDHKPTNTVMGKAVWAFNPAPAGDGATAWCVVYYNATSPSRILYNANAGQTVRKISEKMHRRKLRPTSEGNTLANVAQLEHYTDFTVQNYVLRLMQYKQPGYSGVKIFDKADFEKASTNGQL